MNDGSSTRSSPHSTRVRRRSRQACHTRFRGDAVPRLSSQGAVDTRVSHTVHDTENVAKGVRPYGESEGNSHPRPESRVTVISARSGAGDERHPNATTWRSTTLQILLQRAGEHSVRVERASVIDDSLRSPDEPIESAWSAKRPIFFTTVDSQARDSTADRARAVHRGGVRPPTAHRDTDVRYPRNKGKNVGR